MLHLHQVKGGRQFVKLFLAAELVCLVCMVVVSSCLVSFVSDVTCHKELLQLNFPVVTLEMKVMHVGC